METETAERVMDWREMLRRETEAGGDGRVHCYDFPCPVMQNAGCDRLGTRGLFLEEGVAPRCHDGRKCLVTVVLKYE